MYVHYYMYFHTWKFVVPGVENKHHDIATYMYMCVIFTFVQYICQVYWLLLLLLYSNVCTLRICVEKA